MMSPSSKPSIAWAPLNHPVYRALWIATLVSNVGTWMQDVAAAWLMTSLSPSPVMVSLVRAAASLPMFVLALPAGVIADLADRRRLLLLTQSWMAFGAALLGTLTLLGATTPAVLLTLTFLLGLGGALNAPAWQAMVPEMVPSSDLPAAISLNSMAFNLARSAGPALAGILLAATGVGTLFLLNAASFLGVIFVLYRWRRNPPVSAFPAERLGGALRAGIRYLRHAPELHSVLVRAALFVFCASALWALLPLITRVQLGLGPAGYGTFLGIFGVGAVAGATMMPRLRRRFSLDALVSGAGVAYAAALLGLAGLRHFGLLCLLLGMAGGAWLLTLASFNTSVQTTVPSWVRARALSGYLLVFFGGMALGSPFWGMVATRFGMPSALVAAGLGMMGGLLARRRFPLTGGESLQPAPTVHWPAPRVGTDFHPEAGPVMVQIAYRIDPAQREAFADTMAELRRLRRRNGAVQWCLFNDMADPERWLESYLVDSWADHLRQQHRLTLEDRRAEERARTFHRGEEPPVISYFLSKPVRRDSRQGNGKKP